MEKIAEYLSLNRGQFTAIVPAPVFARHVSSPIAQKSEVPVDDFEAVVVCRVFMPPELNNADCDGQAAVVNVSKLAAALETNLTPACSRIQASMRS